MSVLVAKGLIRQFNGLRAVDNVTLEIPEQQVRALIGPNGAGKTTLVGLLSGRLACSNGRIDFLGRDITKVPPHKRIAMGMAYTFQITSIFPSLSVHENVAIAARRLCRNEKDTRAVVADALKRVSLAHVANTDAADLSYGHQRLLEIAMGLSQSPRLLILDEPTQGLAEGEVAEFIKLIHDIRQNTTVLLIEHNMDVVMQVADVVTVLNHGQVLFEGTPADVQANIEVQTAYLGGAHVKA
ncbi:ABC transporter ATP-binding protein [Shimia marina]|uniref:Lipopolysaccharide export system ATP-binding protein LptB n=1 Tax=Shimia marina TaxID=321267 RepID=A0A0P1ESR2_9RHOB|nr:ABC transporter ATP-binding protein [Shimia marina]CUH53601.1 Lipopolysaccharide export system ATP-binding protein LptB [Shimia marina]SFD73162.1 amino acid/amide ABC transporter ATP-binding protein 1, HAAT family [Shimia marina]